MSFPDDNCEATKDAIVWLVMRIVLCRSLGKEKCCLGLPRFSKSRG